RCPPRPPLGRSLAHGKGRRMIAGPAENTIQSKSVAGDDLRSHRPAAAVSSALVGLTAGCRMGPRGPPPRKSPATPDLKYGCEPEPPCESGCESALGR